MQALICWTLDHRPKIQHSRALYDLEHVDFVVSAADIRPDKFSLQTGAFDYAQ